MRGIGPTISASAIRCIWHVCALVRRRCHALPKFRHRAVIRRSLHFISSPGNCQPMGLGINGRAIQLVLLEPSGNCRHAKHIYSGQKFPSGRSRIKRQAIQLVLLEPLATAVELSKVASEARAARSRSQRSERCAEEARDEADGAPKN